MSCNCPTPNQCADTTEVCLCGITLNIYNSTGVLVETVQANTFEGEGGTYYEVYNSTAFESELGVGYILTIYYNPILSRWEMSYYNEALDLNIVIGVLYGLQSTDCPLSNCWDLDCIAVALNILGVFDSYFSWQGVYNIANKKSYTFTSNWSGSSINYELYWTPDSSTVPGSAAPFGTPAWILQEEVSPGVWSPTAYLFNSNPCPYGQYITEFGGPDTRFSFTDLGVTGFDMKTIATDCGCCDESVIIDVVFDESTFNDVQANIVKDEYGNVLTINGKPYYTFELRLTPTSATFYLYYTGSSWIMSDSLDEEGAIYAELISTNDCPFGSYQLSRGPVSLFSVIGSECFDCCDYYAPRNRNLLKKKKAIFVEEIASIRNKEIFGLKCGPEWSDLFKKHLIFDVLWCLPYGVLCDDEEQCLINNLNENCNC